MSRAMSLPAVSDGCPTSGDHVCDTVLSWTGNESLAHAASWAVGRPVSILLTLIGGWLIRRYVHRVINRLTTRVVARSGVGGERREARTRTTASLLRSITNVVVIVVVGSMILAQLGFPIGPLLASAGIIGVAFGFGAQSLVKDFLSGIFMLFEDQYGVGDTVELGTTVGVVEDVGLRVTRLRDDEGAIWYIRNGEITRVANRSQG